MTLTTRVTWADLGHVPCQEQQAGPQRLRPGQRGTPSDPGIGIVITPSFDAVWLVRRTRLPLIVQDCPVCSSSRYSSTGKFRVNANGKLLDVWLLMHCVKCTRTAKRAILQRVHVRTIPPAQLQRFTDNDPVLAEKRLIELATSARKQRVHLDWTGCWIVDRSSTLFPSTGLLSIAVRLIEPIPLRPAQVIAEGFGIPRAEVNRMIGKGEILSDRELRGKLSSGFSFTVSRGGD